MLVAYQRTDEAFVIAQATDIHLLQGNGGAACGSGARRDRKSIVVSEAYGEQARERAGL
jgi:hypothetical protein